MFLATLMCKMYEEGEKEEKKLSRQFAYYCLLYIYCERIRIHCVDNWCIAIVEGEKKNSCKVGWQLLQRLVSVVMIVLHRFSYSLRFFFSRRFE